LAGTDARTRLRLSAAADADPAHKHEKPELYAPQWLDMTDISCLNMPGIVRISLGKLPIR
jgi:hypothetical protein